MLKHYLMLVVATSLLLSGAHAAAVDNFEDLVWQRPDRQFRLNGDGIEDSAIYFFTNYSCPDCRPLNDALYSDMAEGFSVHSVHLSTQLFPDTDPSDAPVSPKQMAAVVNVLHNKQRLDNEQLRQFNKQLYNVFIDASMQVRDENIDKNTALAETETLIARILERYYGVSEAEFVSTKKSFYTRVVKNRNETKAGIYFSGLAGLKDVEIKKSQCGRMYPFMVVDNTLCLGRDFLLNNDIAKIIEALRRLQSVTAH